LAAGKKAINDVHDLGIHHRDTLPGNIIIGKNGKGKMIDFGQAVELHSNPKEREHQKWKDHRRFEINTQTYS
jgi:serine/threonine protein kinase